MRRVYLLAACAVLLVCATGAALISQEQAIVGGSLSELKFELVPAAGAPLGAPSEYKITPATLKHLEELMKDGKVIVVDAKGAFKAAAPTKPSSR